MQASLGYDVTGQVGLYGDSGGLILDCFSLFYVFSVGFLHVELMAQVKMIAAKRGSNEGPYRSREKAEKK